MFKKELYGLQERANISINVLILISQYDPSFDNIYLPLIIICVMGLPVSGLMNVGVYVIIVRTL